jgi:hypothetical protein
VTCAVEATSCEPPMKATKECHRSSFAASISAVCGRMRTSNLGRLCDAPRGASGEGREWCDGDPSRVEPTEGFNGVEDLAGLDRDEPSPNCRGAGREAC